MTELFIWTDKQIGIYDQPPKFNSIERKKYFSLPKALLERVKTFHSLPNKVGFYMMFAYFKATQRFFSPVHFYAKDMHFVAHKVGWFFFPFEDENKPISFDKFYANTTYNRHRKIILAHFGYTAFQIKEHRPLVYQIIQQGLANFQRPSLLLSQTLEGLAQRRIELPSYYTLQTILTIHIRRRNRQLHQQLEQFLTDKYKMNLNTLLSKRVLNQENKSSDKASESIKPSQSLYWLTYLKKLIRKDNPKSIRINVSKHQVLFELFDTVEPLLSILQLNDSGIRYFGELVIKYQAQQIWRRRGTAKYLLLLGFVAYQVRSYEDQLVDIYLSACQSALNTAQSKYKNYLFESRLQRQEQMKNALQLAQSKQGLLHEIRTIIHQPSTVLSATQKVSKIKQLLPLIQGLSLEDALVQINENETGEVQQIQDDYSKNQRFLDALQAQSLSLQQQLNPILKVLHFDATTSSDKLIKAIQYFKTKGGKIDKNAPSEFLDEKERAAVFFNNQGQDIFNISLYKILLFKAVHYGIKSGALNLKYSYRYKAYQDYLIPAEQWDKNKTAWLQKAGLSSIKTVPATDFEQLLPILKTNLDQQFIQTNMHILKTQNNFFKLRPDGRPSIKTPKLDTQPQKDTISVFPREKIIPLGEVLATINQLTTFSKSFQHYQVAYRKQRPHNNVFFATIVAYGCNLGVETMAKVARSVDAHQLENTAKWYFDLQNIRKATQLINEFTAQLDLAKLFQAHPEQLHIASDGQKIPVRSTHSNQNTIDASRSFKYFGQTKGVSSYGFIDERGIPPYSALISPTDREAIYVLDGLMHNEVSLTPKTRAKSLQIKHSTDTHGFSETLFGLMDLLDFQFLPRIAKIHKQSLYSFERIAAYRKNQYPILPQAYINTELIEDNWDAILRLTVSLKLKYCTASQIFKRFNSYSRQHTVYQALKEYGRIFKTEYLLQFIDQVQLRQAVQKQLNLMEMSNRFSSAITIGNGGEMIFITRQEQLIADACKNLIKATIIAWNYLYLTRYIQNIKDDKQKQEVINTITKGTPMAWGHIYFNGVFDFSDENTTDSFNLLNSQNYAL